MEPKGSVPYLHAPATFPYPDSDQFNQLPTYTTSWSTLVLSSHPRLGIPSSLFSSGLLTKTLYASLLSSIRAICPAHLILLDLITRIFGEKYRSQSSSLCSLLRSPVTSSVLGSNNFLSTLFSNNHVLCSSLSMRDQVSNPYKTTG